MRLVIYVLVSCILPDQTSPTSSWMHVNEHPVCVDTLAQSRRARHVSTATYRRGEESFVRRRASYGERNSINASNVTLRRSHVDVSHPPPEPARPVRQNPCEAYA